MSTTPNMNLLLPTPTSTAGPEWASELNTALGQIDDHDHSSGKGKKINPAGMDINADLDIDEHSLLNVLTANLVNQSAPSAGVDNACTLQFANGNFYIVNSGGTAVQITNGGSIVSTVVIPASPLMPSGTILDFAGSTIPVGFLACDGSAVSRTTYSDLFNAIGTSWGPGNGTTTFTLPNFNGKVGVGSGTYDDAVLGSVTRSLAQGQYVGSTGTRLGAAAHVLTIAEMPIHTHTQNPHSHAIASNSSASRGDGASGTIIPGSSVTSDATATNQNTGGDTAHNNMQPSLVINKMIKT